MPPEPDDPTAVEDETHQPGGDLHTLAAKSEEPEPPLDDNLGDLPEELAEPPDSVPEPKGSVYPEPTAISLNEG